MLSQHAAQRLVTLPSVLLTSQGTVCGRPALLLAAQASEPRARALRVWWRSEPGGAQSLPQDQDSDIRATAELQPVALSPMPSHPPARVH